MPAPVTVEVCWLLEKYQGADAEAAFLESIARGDLEVIDLTRADIERVIELVRQYADFPLGTVDASVVAVAERLGIPRVATLDRRHFTAVRPRHVSAFTLLP
ncbi:type II toxin-antitoxin system VapC family toxin [Actinopolymorpha alba]|uniref:type II toxin-antitoxin system VapC family toxin n=1 Tax=Actinopolymorpha alba TaxID=533267 RepID=UPI00192B82D6|nr:PIN domain-containing protein [Actinopolymorpha alba]